MSHASIDEIWARLKSLQGQEFETKTGNPFGWTPPFDWGSLMISEQDGKFLLVEVVKQ